MNYVGCDNKYKNMNILKLIKKIKKIIDNIK